MDLDKHKCSSIDHIKTDAIIFCHLCKVYLCNKCETFHSKLFSNHPVQNLTKEKNNLFLNICQEKNHFNKLKYFCKSHNKLCCASCITKIKDEENGQHKDCEICLLNDIKEEKEKKFNEDFNKLELISKSLEQTINQLKSLYENINKQKEELILNIQKAFTEIRNAINQREDQLLLEVEEIYKKNFFGEEIIRESEKLPGKIKKCLESGDEIKNKWNKENELSEAINYCIEFGNSLDKIDEINQKINKCNSNEIEIDFEIDKKKFEEEIKTLGILNEKEKEDKKEKAIHDLDEEPQNEKSRKSSRSNSSSKSDKSISRSRSNSSKSPKKSSNRSRSNSSNKSKKSNSSISGSERAEPDE